jgi:osmotically-inducible protein OsmY
MVSPITTVTNRVLENLQDDPRTKDAVIDATFHQGTLTLTGTVKSEAVRQAAQEIARNDPGVTNVVNEIKVK